MANLTSSLQLDDASGRAANMAVKGLLSTLSPFDQFLPEMWQQALEKADSKPLVRAAFFSISQIIYAISNKNT